MVTANSVQELLNLLPANESIGMVDGLLYMRQPCGPGVMVSEAHNWASTFSCCGLCYEKNGEKHIKSHRFSRTHH